MTAFLFGGVRYGRLVSIGDKNTVSSNRPQKTYGRSEPAQTAVD